MTGFVLPKTLSCISVQYLLVFTCACRSEALVLSQLCASGHVAVFPYQRVRACGIGCTNFSFRYTPSHELDVKSCALLHTTTHPATFEFSVLAYRLLLRVVLLPLERRKLRGAARRSPIARLSDIMNIWGTLPAAALLNHRAPSTLLSEKG